MIRLLFEKYSLQEKITSLGVFSVIGLGISIPLSTSLTSVFTILATFFWLLSWKIKETYELFFYNPVIRAALLLFILFLIGVVFSSAGLNEALHGVNTYRKLFLIVIFASFMKKDNHRYWAIYAFYLGCFVLLCTSCVSAWKILPFFSLASNTISGRVTHSLFMAFFAFWLATNFMISQRFRLIYGIVFCLVVYNLFFIVNGRTGYVVFLSLMVFFFCHYFNKKKLIIAVLVAGGLLLSSLIIPNRFSERLFETRNNIQSYLQTGNNNTSIGQRLDFTKTSLMLFAEKPIWGYGTGSFKNEYEKKSQLMGTFKTDNPHNEYLSIAVQLGLVGLITWVYLLAVQWKYSKKIKHDKVLAQGVVLTMVIGSFMNSMLLDSGEGHFYAFFTAIIFANIRSRTKPEVVNVSR